MPHCESIMTRPFSVLSREEGSSWLAPDLNKTHFSSCGFKNTTPLAQGIPWSSKYWATSSLDMPVIKAPVSISTSILLPPSAEPTSPDWAICCKILSTDHWSSTSRTLTRDGSLSVCNILASLPFSNLQGYSCADLFSSCGNKSEGVPLKARRLWNSNELPKACPDAEIFSSWHCMTLGKTWFFK